VSQDPPLIHADEWLYWVHLVFKRGVGEAGLVIDLFIGQLPDNQIEVINEQAASRQLI